MRLSLLVLNLLVLCDVVVSARIPVRSGEEPDLLNSNLHHPRPRHLFPYLANMVSQLLGKNEIHTPLGPIRGTVTLAEGVKRYVIEYGRAERWKPSYPVHGRIRSLK
jgi:hypothetical protein